VHTKEKQKLAGKIQNNAEFYSLRISILPKYFKTKCRQI